MTLLGRLSRRMLLLAGASGLLGAALGLLMARNGARSTLATLVREGFERTKDACRAEPDRWTFFGPGELRGFAYDGASHASRNPEAPALDLALLAELPREPGAAVWRSAGQPFGGRILVRTASPGPCELVQADFSGRKVEGAAVQALAGAAGGSVLVALALGMGLVVWPLSRRTARLGAAAARLGQLEGALAPRTDPAGDELDAALASLVAADARIRSDAERLQTRSQALERHLAEVAHDLRTPLAALQLSVEQAADVADADARRELLGAALQECVYLAELAENLRVKSLLEEGWKPRPSPVDLGALVQRICDRVRPLARRRGLSVEFAVPDEALVAPCDAVAIERVLTNLVENAVNHGERGGHVALTLAREPSRFAVEVLDDGPGVRPEVLARLAERRLSSEPARSREALTGGLGLPIAAELCARCGWSLSYSALEPHGLKARLQGPLGAT